MCNKAKPHSIGSEAIHIPRFALALLHASAVGRVSIAEIDITHRTWQDRCCSLRVHCVAKLEITTVSFRGILRLDRSARTRGIEYRRGIRFGRRQYSWMYPIRRTNAGANRVSSDLESRQMSLARYLEVRWFGHLCSRYLTHSLTHSFTLLNASSLRP